MTWTVAVIIGILIFFSGVAVGFALMALLAMSSGNITE